MVELNTAMNVTSSLAGFTNGESWFGIVFVVGFAAIIMSILFMMIGNINFYFKGRKFINFLLTSVRFFFFGIATLLCLSVPALIFYYFFYQAKKGNVAPIWMTGAIIGGYIIISFIGWFSKKYIFERVKFFEIKFREQENEQPI